MKSKFYLFLSEITLENFTYIEILLLVSPLLRIYEMLKISKSKFSMFEQQPYNKLTLLIFFWKFAFEIDLWDQM